VKVRIELRKVGWREVWLCLRRRDEGLIRRYLARRGVGERGGKALVNLPQMGIGSLFSPEGWRKGLTVPGQSNDPRIN
jgi:hypothetical protein